MERVDIHGTFGPPVGDRATLSKASRVTLDALYRHPLSHNLEWSDVVALFEKLGSVDHRSNNDIAFSVAGEHHLIHKPRSKDLTGAEVMQFRHILSRTGWSPEASDPLQVVADTLGQSAVTAAEPPSVLVVVDHHEARLYHLDIRSGDALEHVIAPYDPHHILHHLSHKDSSRERGQRAPEDASFYRRIAEALVSAGRIVLIGHGKGHSNAAHHLAESLRMHQPDTFRRVVCEVVADLSSLTPSQLLELGRRALTPGVTP